MDTRRNEIVSKCIHEQKRGHLGGVPEVISIESLGEGGTGHRLHSDKPDIFARRLFGHEGESQACEVAASTATATARFTWAKRTIKWLEHFLKYLELRTWMLQWGQF